MKLRNLFNKNEDSDVSGSFSGRNEDSEVLLGYSDNEDDFDTFKPRSMRAERKVDQKRGRLQRSASARMPSNRSPPKRSKSEVGKRLKAIADDFGTSRKNKKKGTSKSLGGTFKGSSSQIRSRIDHLALERSGSDKGSGLDSLFADSAPIKKKLRGGKRSSFGADSVAKKDEKERSAPGRSRSTRSERTVGDKARSSSEARSRSKGRDKSRTRSSSKRRSSSKIRRTSSKLDDTYENTRTDDSKEDSKKKKKSEKDKKKKKSKDSSDGKDDSSLPSKVEVNETSSSTSSLNDSSSHTKKKKTKEKEKVPKKSKRQSKSFPDLPPDDFGDGLEGLAEEFRRSKESISGVSSGTSTNPFDPPPSPSNLISKQESEEKVRQAVEIETKKNSEQQEEILNLQQQLSTALQKQLTMSEEHIREKNEFMNVSRELERTRLELVEARQERDNVLEEMKERDQAIREDLNKIRDLERERTAQLQKEEELKQKLQRSNDEVQNLLDEIEKMEKKASDGEGSNGGGASFVLLRKAKDEVAEKEEENATLKSRIEELKKEVEDALTVPQLQIEELDQENKALQGRLKGERLEYTSKISAKDDTIESLRTELASYTSAPDAQDLAAARQQLADARGDANQVREDLATHVKTIEQLHGEREDFMEEFNAMKDNNAFMEKTIKELTEKAEGLDKKILVWTEKCYDWKEKFEGAEKKLAEAGIGEEKEGEPQGMGMGMSLQAAMDKGQGKGPSWAPFFKKAEGTDEEKARVKKLEEDNLEFEAKIAQLNSDLVKMRTAHKEELYTTKKRIAELEGENEALSLSLQVQQS